MDERKGSEMLSFSFGMKYEVGLNEEDVSNFRLSIFMSLLTPDFFGYSKFTHETACVDSKPSAPLAIRRAFSRNCNKLWKKVWKWDSNENGSVREYFQFNPKAFEFQLCFGLLSMNLILYINVSFKLLRGGLGKLLWN